MTPEPQDAVFAPLHGKARSAAQALAEVAAAWTRTPLTEPAGREALVDAVAHLLRRARVRRDPVVEGDAGALAARFVAALATGEGSRAVALLVPAVPS